ncbi:PAS domain-containing sensor histidine kinase [Mucilaginibacter aquaedulcis]|uniref:PAS domain-containing sensor histidine kinase n=1 Tax=Mucilaginibacter aquaedulcis TaxID=1187081 RepID=UPI0025B56E85|nr:ATP-binding protein [Mucilaginibacter aquaedulcis]MDN3548166.1 ATP-binding protein [Mucilaginibacter aquaedulcis]
MSDTMLGFWGRDRSVIGLPLETAIPELAGQRFLDELRSVIHSGVTVIGKGIPAELQLEGKLQTRYYDYEYRALRNAEGQIYCLLHTTTEVTDSVLGKVAIQKLEQEQSLNEELAAANEELIATNEELNQSRQSLYQLKEELEWRVKERTDAAETAAHRLEAMVMNTPIAMTILRGHDLIVEVANQPMLEVWRRTLNQVIGRGLVEIFPELEGQPNPGRMRGVMQSGCRFTLPETEVILGTVDGVLKKHYARFSYDPIIERDGAIESILVTVINITDEVTNRQQLEKSRKELLAATHNLAEANMRLNMAMEASSLGMAEAVFSTGQMISNEQFKKNFGRSGDEELTYPQLFEAMLPEYRDEIKRKVDTAVKNHTIYEAEYEIEWPNGSRHWISAHGIPRYENGVADRIVGVSRVITQQKTVEQQKDDFLSVASHELKTPITALKANLQLLKRLKETPANPVIPKLIDSANKGIEKITILVDDLLNINRFSQSKLELELNSFNVKQMLQNSSTALLAENKYQIVIEGDPELTMVADEHRIEQVVINFINNAVKYAPKSNIILLRFEKNENKVGIAVIDRGPGIPANQLPHLFDRYWRADHSGKKYSGLGLGLFICAEIIERHGGTIGAESILGEGSTFWFKIPVG